MAEATARQNKWRWQVNMGTANVPDWQTVVGLQEFSAPVEPTDQEDNDYENDGWLGDTRTALKWSISANISYRQDNATFVANAVHVKLRDAASVVDTDEGVVHMRWFDKRGGDQAYEGYGLVTWEPDGGATVDLERISITVGPSAASPALVTIANPVNAAPVPIVSSVSPATGDDAGGTLVTITGANFTGATDVEFDDVNATSFLVVSATKISAVVPAGTAGPANVDVTTPNGTGTGTAVFTYTA